MLSLPDILSANPTATAEQLRDLHNAQQPTPKTSSAATYVTYLSIGEDVARFGAGAMNFAGRIRAGLAAWIAGPDLTGGDAGSPLPNTGALQTIDGRLAGAKGVDLSSPTAPGIVGLFAAGIPGLHDPIITPEQAAALLSIGYDVVTPVTVEEAQAAIDARDAEQAKQTLRDKLVAGYNAAIAGLDDGTLTTWQAVLAKVGE